MFGVVVKSLLVLVVDAYPTLVCRLCGVPGYTAVEPATEFLEREILVDEFDKLWHLSVIAGQWLKQQLSVTAGDGPDRYGSSPICGSDQGFRGWCRHASASRWSGFYVTNNGNYSSSVRFGNQPYETTLRPHSFSSVLLAHQAASIPTRSQGRGAGIGLRVSSVRSRSGDSAVGA